MISKLIVYLASCLMQSHGGGLVSLCDYSNTVQFVNNGIQITILKLLKYEIAQEHFIVAYSEKKQKPANWFAADPNLLKLFPNL